MYTQSNAYVRKLSSGTILTLLLLSAILVLIPAATHATITGATPTLGAVNQVTSPQTYTSAPLNISVVAGSATVTAINNVAHTGLFAINFTLTSFSGAQFWLYMSPNGGNNLNTTGGDIKYAGPFSKSDFAAYVGTLHNVTFSGIHYYIGTTSGGIAAIVGPIPITISSNYNYIKVYDGSCGSNPTFCGGAGMAVAAQLVAVQPGITVTPTSGPAGTTVTVSGGGFPVSTLIDLNYSFTVVSFSSSYVTTPVKGNLTTVNTGQGYFTKSVAMVDAKQVINPPPIAPLLYVMVAISATHYAGISTVVYANTTFTENNRFISQVKSLDSSGHVVTPTENPFISGVMYGNENGSSTSPVYNLATQNAVSLGSLIIAGNDSLVNSVVTFWVGSTATGGTLTQVGSTTSNGIGNFNGTASIPPLSNGLHLVVVENNGVRYWFQVFILPSLVLTPTSGPVHTTVSVKGYGFPAGANVYLYWYEITTDDYTYFNLNSTSGSLVNVTVPANGFFSGVQFYTPHSYGGYHDVSASTSYVKNPDYVPATDIADSSFSITPTVVISPATIPVNTKGFLNVTGTGFNPEAAYYVSVDNSLFGAGYPGFVATYNGDLFLNFTSTGLQPGLHQVEMYPNCDWEYYSCGTTGSYAPIAYTYFNITGIGGTDGGSFNSTTLNNINTNVNTILSKVNTILGWQAYIVNTNATVGRIYAWGPTITSMNSHITSIFGWQSTIVNINSTVNGIKATLITMTGTLTTIIGDITSATNAATAAKTSADAASAAATNAKTSVSDTTTYVLVVAVLAAITLVLELAILVRKLD